jgi:hypothetical protein
MAPVPVPRMMSMPQLEMHPNVSGAAVPGGPVLVSMQKSLVRPHWPQMFQQAFNGHGLSWEITSPRPVVEC